MPILNKDMTLCISLAARPSNIGTRFHNYLYEELGLNYIYKAFTTSDLPSAIAGLRGLGIRVEGIGHPMGRDHPGLMRNTELIQNIHGMPHHIPV